MASLVIGISGVTCGGKTTLAMELSKLLPNSTLMSQDDYFLAEDDPRQVWIPELNHVNYDIVSSLDMKRMHKDLETLLKNHVQKPQDIQIIIVEGFCIFNYEPMRHAFHLKYFLELDEEECWKRRQGRIYEPPDCPGYFQKCAWPEHLKQKQEVLDCLPDVKFIDGTRNDALDIVLGDLQAFFSRHCKVDFVGSLFLNQYKRT